MKLVVIDDDAMVLKTLEKALREYGFDSVVFRDPREGVEWIRRNGADIVLCDIRMPECDGFEVLRQVKEAFFEDCLEIRFGSSHPGVDGAQSLTKSLHPQFFPLYYQVIPFSGEGGQSPSQELLLFQDHDFLPPALGKQGTYRQARHSGSDDHYILIFILGHSHHAP